MLHRLRAATRRRRQPPPTAAAPRTIRLAEATTYSADTALDWDGRYLGRVRFQGLTLEGSPANLDRLARELHIAARVAQAAEAIDAGRPGTLTTSGGEG
ncbi:hypothetical protein [Streptomyces yangpuensis]|uniref:hypothetical protein n=1 Tax=Streptomyces yangpuensis TaxID=1648182 RepID=UPI003656D55F